MSESRVIVVLNGPSCAGKSHLCQHFGARNDWVVLAKDSFKEKHWVPMVEALYYKLYGETPEESRPPWPVRCDSPEAIARVQNEPRRWQDMRTFLAAHKDEFDVLVRDVLITKFVSVVISEFQKRNVIVDRGFASNPDEFVGWLDGLRGYPVIFVSVSCPLPALLRRLKERQDRSPGLVEKHVKTVFSWDAGFRSFRKRADIRLRSNVLDPSSLANELLRRVEDMRGRVFDPKQKWRMAFELNRQLVHNRSLQGRVPYIRKHAT